ncbi:MAG: L,D-transpeptidase [Candidatus Omnitrophica bacterium]|nr:L,D-transpeptidase [Candidatus Omnitrophota bacterium]
MNPMKVIPVQFEGACNRHGIVPGQFLLAVSVARQEMQVFELKRLENEDNHFRNYSLLRACVVSTSRFGIGRQSGSNQTPLGLHRIAEKIGGDCPVGTVFKGRKPVGPVEDGTPATAIVHRILWLEGLQPGVNRGEGIDSHSRYIYLHGVRDESTLGRPASRGCIHLGSADLLWLYDLVPEGTLVWIADS